MNKITFKKSIFRGIGQTALLTASALLLFACSNDDDDNPMPVEEEETITTMTITLAPEGGGEAITFQSRDLDGDGPNAPEITVSNLAVNTSYTGSIELLNETESPAERITPEIQEEDEDHQFFFAPTGSLTGTSYADSDGNSNPVGLIFRLNTGVAGDGSLTVTLRHLPKKPNDGTLADAGGETDIAQTFDVLVE
ncbi:type 1 periplasmic binding fold superfamily protein [Pricia sp.]|uniref:type 1 periplasmic binding fold superfamily protein n=1 Tax=Pricia sp. TaxID=2268138 RepID=UPI0035946DEB